MKSLSTSIRLQADPADPHALAQATTRGTDGARAARGTAAAGPGSLHRPLRARAPGARCGGSQRGRYACPLVKRRDPLHRAPCRVPSRHLRGRWRRRRHLSGSLLGRLLLQPKLGRRHRLPRWLPLSRASPAVCPGAASLLPQPLLVMQLDTNLIDPSYIPKSNRHC